MGVPEEEGEGEEEEEGKEEEEEEEDEEGCYLTTAAVAHTHTHTPTLHKALPGVARRSRVMSIATCFSLFLLFFVPSSHSHRLLTAYY